MQKYLKILVMLLFCVEFVHAQRVVRLFVFFDGKDSSFLKKNVSYIPFHPDSLSVQRELDDVLVKLNELSFLQAGYRSLYTVNDTCVAIADPGKSYQWIRLSKGNVPDDILSAAGFRENQFAGKMFEPRRYRQKVDRILQTLEESGFPFATVKLDSIEADSFGITASLNLQKNEQIFFDTIGIVGDAAIRKVFLQKYLGIKPGAPYNEALIKNADSRVSQLPFLKTSRATSIYFYGTKALPYLYLENRKASTIDGIIGFAPNSEVNDKLLITGEANLKLQNLFSRGVSLEVNYRSFLANSQDLRIKTVYPYIFNTNLALDYELNLLKLDSTFLDVKNEFAVQYRFIGTDHFKVFYSIQTASLITVDTLRIKATRALPEASDLRSDLYGTGFKFTRYDYFLNPRRGFSAEFTAGVGIKRIIRNPTIEALRFINPDGTFASIYDTIQLRQVQYRVQGNADRFFPFGSRFTARGQVNGGHIVAKNLFFNELFRIGGIRTLKGFDEQSIFASSYLIINTEVRYLLQQNSNFMLFWNGAWYENTVRSPRITDTPYGFGAGMNFETAAGIFSLYYAVGKERGNPVEYEKAKVHFGFVTVF